MPGKRHKKYTVKQLRWLGAVAGGKNRKKASMSRAKAKSILRRASSRRKLKRAAPKRRRRR